MTKNSNQWGVLPFKVNGTSKSKKFFGKNLIWLQQQQIEKLFERINQLRMLKSWRRNSFQCHNQSQDRKLKASAHTALYPYIDHYINCLPNCLPCLLERCRDRQLTNTNTCGWAVFSHVDFRFRDTHATERMRIRLQPPRPRPGETCSTSSFSFLKRKIARQEKQVIIKLFSMSEHAIFVRCSHRTSFSWKMSAL